MEHPIDLAAHEQRIASVLEGVVYRNGSWMAVENDTPLTALLDREKDPAQRDEYYIRHEAFKRLMQFLVADGLHPGCIVRRFFVIAKAVTPELIGDMSLAEIGHMLGETRAAQSWRVKKIFNGYLASKHNGGAHTRASFQKKATTCARYSRSAKGNHNRAASFTNPKTSLES